MENLMEMEYVINGEKYLITVTKVEDTTETSTTEVVEVGVPDMEPTDFVEVEVDSDRLVQISVSLMPAGFSLNDWLDVIKSYGVILTD